MNTIAVLGAGTMGHGIAQVCAMAGYRVHLTDPALGATERGLGAIARNLEAGVARGKVTAEARDAALAALTPSPDLAAACASADLIIEAAPERLDLKQRIVSEVCAAAPGHAIVGTNTSSLSIGAIAAAADQPGRVIGTHFFNPVHLMALLELVVADATDPATLDAARAFGARIGKEVIVVRDVPGFATSRLGVALGMEAIRMVESGVASPEDIDKAMVLGYRHPVGPLRLTDMVGLDVRLNIGEYLARELGNPAFEPPALLRRMVADGQLGKKSGQGFYTWDA
jgi:3-hydroxybutyryl-CoA dehydrogenase